MSQERSPQGNACPDDELGPELEKAVDALLQDEPPAQWSAEMLERIRQQQPSPPPRKTSRRAKIVAIATVAASLLLVVGLEQFGVFEEVKQFVSSVFSDQDTEDDDESFDGHGADDVPEEKPAGDHPANRVLLAKSNAELPTLWAYRQANQESPDALDSLLDQHAQNVKPAGDLDLAGMWDELL